jgi:hypothetical protein
VRTARAAGVLLAVAVIALAFAARRGRKGAAELEPHPPRPGAVSPPPFAVKLPPPNAGELEEGLRRAFGETVHPAAGSSRGLVGDFNGDGAEDVAVPVSPAAGRLEELNDGLANWRVQDAREDPAGERGPPPKGDRSAVRVQPQDVLLAVVHGYGVRGWRDERARQSYLIRHATGAPFEARPRTELLRYVRRVPDEPRLTGDVILVSAGRKPGFVYWTGARYSWHPLPKEIPPHPPLCP